MHRHKLIVVPILNMHSMSMLPANAQQTPTASRNHHEVGGLLQQ